VKRKLEPLLQFAVQTAYEAGRLTLGYFRTGLQPEYKSDDSPVTVADREAETLIRRRIEKHYPTHGIVGEEHGVRQGREADFCWIIDPIDGTKAFIRGVPLYAVLIGLEIEGRCEVGAVFFPALDEMIYAASGGGCFCNGRRVKVAATRTLDRSYVSFTGAASFAQHGRQAAFQRLLDRCYHSVGWSDAYGHALVATGRLEIMLDPVLNPYDCAPFPPLLREAGGYFGDWSGNETIYGAEGLSTTRALLPEVLSLLEERG
jgi:histidinol-phosphatase